jgi:GR25 family glycosyltransferase involved in LPS biosynthesis
MNPVLAPFVDAAFCINLARRTDRWSSASSQFRAAGLDVIRFDAVDGASFPSHLIPPSPPLKAPLGPGAYCSLLSHLSVISLAKNAGMRGVLIFEDDLLISPSFLEKTAQFLTHVPHDWDMLYWGGKVLLDAALVNEYVMRPSYVYNCFAYAVSSNAYDRLIDALRTKGHWADQLMAGLHPQMRVYMPRSRFVWQRRDQGSDNKERK